MIYCDIANHPETAWLKVTRNIYYVQGSGNGAAGWLWLRDSAETVARMPSPSSSVIYGLDGCRTCFYRGASRASRLSPPFFFKGEPPTGRAKRPRCVSASQLLLEQGGQRQECPLLLSVGSPTSPFCCGFWTTQESALGRVGKDHAGCARRREAGSLGATHRQSLMPKSQVSHLTRMGWVS